jgi:SH3 domain-containing YSC84-like protein 1
MRVIGAIIGVMVLLASSAFADITAAEQQRLKEAAGVLAGFHGMTDSPIPDDLWNKAACVAAIPSVKKAAFIFGGEYGKGVMSCRTESGWSAPAFFQLEKGSWGFQAGAEEIDLVLLVMNRRGVDKLLQDKVSLGAGASVAAGPVGRTAAASTDLQMSAEILSYSRSQGVFAGVDLSGGVLQPDTDANHDVYGAAATAREIILKAGTTTPPAAAAFMRTLRGGAAR